MRRALVSAQTLRSDGGGIATCARLTVIALQNCFEKVTAIAAQDSAPARIARTRTSVFHNSRPGFVLANALVSAKSDLIFYDFPGTARAHALTFGRRPCAVWAHGWEVWQENLREDYARALRRASTVFVNSNHTRLRLLESIPDLANVQVCWLGVEDCRFDEPASALEGADSKFAAPQILFAGRNDDLFAKGQDILLEIWPEIKKAVPRATLHFVGGGINLPKLQALAAANVASDSINVWGALSDQQLALRMSQAAIFVLLSRVEGFGLVTVEAMKYGIPAITSSDDASHEVVLEGRTGYAIPREDKDQIVEKILSLLTDFPAYSAFREASRAHWEENFTLDAFCNRFLGKLKMSGVVDQLC